MSSQGWLISHVCFLITLFLALASFLSGAGSGDVLTAVQHVLTRVGI